MRARLPTVEIEPERPADAAVILMHGLGADGHDFETLVFELKEAEDRPTAEVAEILGLTPGAVRVHLHRARLRLRARLTVHFRGRDETPSADEARA